MLTWQRGSSIPQELIHVCIHNNHRLKWMSRDSLFAKRSFDFEIVLNDSLRRSERVLKW